eukprot:612625-Prymnesium_polylepis.2
MGRDGSSASLQNGEVAVPHLASSTFRKRCPRHRKRKVSAYGAPWRPVPTALRVGSRASDFHPRLWQIPPPPFPGRS